MKMLAREFNVGVRSFGPMVMAILLFVLTILGMRPLTQYIVNEFVLKPGTIEAIGLNPDPEILYGSILQSKAIETDGIVPIYGSSELGTGFEFNPTQVFANKPTGFSPFIIGRGSVQSLVNVLNLAAQDDLRGRKLVFTFSPDWFAAKNGLTSERLAMNSSALHVYQIVLSPKVSGDFKKEIAKRVLEVPDVIKDYPNLRILLQTYLSEDWGSKTKRVGLWPLAEVKLAALEIQDARQVRTLLHQVKQNSEKEKPAKENFAIESGTPTNSGVPWDQLLERSVHRGKSLISNNLNILDSSYPTHTQSGKKGSWKNLKLYPSKEYQDFDLLLRILEEKGAEPLFVLIPANGRWADYAEFPAGERKDYYHRIREMVQEHGFHIADFSDKEYEPYFMQDPWHIGLRGWAEVDQAIDEFVNS